MEEKIAIHRNFATLLIDHRLRSRPRSPVCGIAGTFTLAHTQGHLLATPQSAQGHRPQSAQGHRPRDPAEQVREALTCLAHRGPDDEGLYEEGSCVLGHRRLSIIDTSSAGHQPFVDDGGRYVMVLNGEIFNFQQLRAQLEEQGHHFRSKTDTEVVLRLFTVKGPAFLDDLNGFFALAIHDKVKDELFLARDRFGVKPLWYGEHDGRSLFSSELRGLLAMGLPRAVDPASLAHYFRFYYTPAPDSAVHGAHKLLPGHCLRVSAAGARIERWYHLPDAVRSVPASKDPIRTLRELLDDAVRLRLIADVPVGTFLSGGLDSSIVSAITARHHRNLHTFSIGYADDPFYDETRYAEEVAAHIGSTHTTFSLTRDDLAKNYAKLLDAIDEPFADSSALPSYILCQRTRAQLTVALSGDGGDEVFGGYGKHQAELRWRAPGAAERAVRALAPLWRVLPRSRNNPLANRVRQLDRFARLAGMDQKERFLELAAFEEKGAAARIMRKNPDAGIMAARDRTMSTGIVALPGLNGVLLADVLSTLPNDMLHKVDLTSMAHALEVRTPFLDKRVVEFAFSLPAEMKFRKGSGKHILREAFGELLPSSIITRRKQGFEVPLLHLFRGALRPLLNDLFQREVVEAAGLRHDEVSRIHARLMGADPGNAQATVHALAVYLSWWKRWMG